MRQPSTLELRARPISPAVIELHGIGASYPGPGRRSRRGPRHRQHCLAPAALSGVDLAVRSGEFVTLTGPPRSGKTTLLSVIALLLRPVAGSYLLNGIDTSMLGDRDRAALRGRQMGLVFQPPHLLPARSALDNVALPLLYAGIPGRPRRSAALDCLDRVGLSGQAHRPAAELSAGERQRVAIARALVTAPGLLVCDDPTAGLDAGQAAQVVGLLTELHAAGRTVLVTSRDQLAAAYSSRCVRIGGGGAETNATG
ncbi:MAG TPA: ABC transporter ATP-binding protein [Streptosporangiaceae bacterium]|nr:ABC transporter ATP-binding protein [Streptosporangiaceae bacterium]